MKFFIKAAALTMLTVSLTLSACGGGGDPGGDPETPASTLFANKSYLAPGAICPAGGIQIDMGFDNNKNNVLDADEITKTEYVCNGEDASSHPFVVYTSPTPNETDVELDTVISAVFNTEMDETTITDETFTVKDSSGNSVAGAVSYSGIVAVFTPAEPLSINMKYTVNLASAIENDNDIAMGYNHKIYFTCAKAAVIYNANEATSGTVPVDTNRYNIGATVNASTNSGNLVKTGFSFSGWNTKADGTGTAYAVNAPINITTTSVILYAMWTTAYTVTYNANGADSGSVPTDSNLYILGQSVTVKANIDLVKSNLNFVGWNTASDGTGFTYATNTEFAMGNANVTLYAKWEVIGFGGITGTSNNINESEIISASYFLFESEINFGANPYDSTDFSQLSLGGQEIINDAGNSGSSVLSQVFAYEVLYRIESALLLKTNDEIIYDNNSGVKTNFLISLDGYKIGVMVTRACHYPQPNLYTSSEANSLLTAKLSNIKASSLNVSDADQWVKQVLVIISYNSQHADVIRTSWNALDAVTKGDTILLIVITSGDDGFLY